VVAAAYQGAQTLLTIKPDVPEAPELKVAQTDAIAVGEKVSVAVRDGWLIPKQEAR
jgi:hypothetical protein